MGICIPKSCTNDEIKNITQEIFDNKNLHFQSIYEMTPQVIDVKDLKLKDEFYSTISFQIFSYISLVTILLVIANLLTDKDYDQENNNESQQSTSLLTRCVRCFSIRENLSWLFNTDTTPASIPVINGIR